MVVKTVHPSLDHLAHNIGISGFKYLLGPDATTVRRLTWFFVIVGAMTWMVWNIYSRLVYYLAYPTTLETQISYQDQIRFPKITICNQNQFRSSQIYKETDEEFRISPDLYQALSEYNKLMSGPKKKNKDVISEKYRGLLASTGTKPFAERVAHNKHTLIQKCSWKGRPCGSDDFTAEETDIGICYSFQTKEEGDNDFVDSAGHEGGLSVTLMVEQYDYMQGSRDSAGAVVVISPRDETEAFANSAGVSVTVGSKTSISLRKTTIRDMPHPHGHCGERALSVFPNGTRYTPLRCQLDCLTRFVRTKCGCIQLYMKNKDRGPFCSLLDNVKCAERAKEMFYSSGPTRQCDCPPPCYSEHYTKTISHTLLSQQYMNSLSFQTSDYSTSSSLKNPSLKHVNEVLMIQAWGLLTATDPDYTDLLANMATSLKNSRQTLVTLNRKVTDFAAAIGKLLSVNTETLPEFADLPGHTEMQTTNETVYALTDSLIQMTSKLVQMHDNSSVWSTKEFGWGLEATLADDFLQPGEKQFIRLNSYLGFCQQKLHAVETCLKAMAVWAVQVLQHSQAPNRAFLQKHVRQILDYNISAVNAVEKCRNASTDVSRYRSKLHDMPPVDNLLQLRLHTYEHLQPSFYQEQGIIMIVGLFILARCNVAVWTLTLRIYAETLPENRNGSRLKRCCKTGNNILSVDIFFEDLRVEEITKSEAYSLEGLVCDIGGSIGLCLGGSILTFIEVIDLLLFSKRKSKESDKEVLVSETALQDLPEKSPPAP